MKKVYVSIPIVRSIMLPLLQEVADGKEYSLKDICERLARKFNLTPEEQNKLLPSGQTVFGNRVGWARTYLCKAGLLSAPRKGTIKITEKGKEVLRLGLNKLDDKFLAQQSEEFKAFIGKAGGKKTPERDRLSSGELIKDERETLPPEELIEEAYNFYNETLISNILDSIRKTTPGGFEKLVIDVLVKMGYGGAFEEAAKVIGRPGDEGIDGVIKQDPLGLDVIYVQAKRWETNIGRQELQKFVGALQGKHAHKGVFITTSDFTEDAKDYVKNLGGNKIVLIDGETLGKLMIKYNVGVTTSKTYEIKKIDSDYFNEIY